MNIEAVADYARVIGMNVAMKWPGTEPEDIAQEITLWILRRPNLFRSFSMACRLRDQDEDIAPAWAFQRVVFTRTGERYCRAKRARQLGYHTNDEYFYPLPYLRLLVEQWFLAGLEERPLIHSELEDVEARKGLHTQSVRKRSTADPSEHGNHLCALLDVSRGMSQLTYRDRLFLSLRFEELGTLNDREVAELATDHTIPWARREQIKRWFGQSEGAVASRTRRILQKLQRRLGGADPWVETELDAA